MYDEREFPVLEISVDDFYALLRLEDDKDRSWNSCQLGSRFRVGEYDNGLVGVVVSFRDALRGQTCDRMLVGINRFVNYFKPLLPTDAE